MRLLAFNKVPNLADDIESYKRRTVVALRTARLFDVEEDIAINENATDFSERETGEHFAVLRTSRIPLKLNRVRLTIHVWVMFEDGAHKRTLVTVKLGSSTVLSQRVHAGRHDIFLRDLHDIRGMVVKCVTTQRNIADDFSASFNNGEPDGDTSRTLELYTKLVNQRETT